jgi:hypothetical protein
MDIKKIPGGVPGCICAELKVGSNPTGAYNLNPDCPIHCPKPRKPLRGKVR